ncbi:MAG: alpha/beta hydrolase [Candidatus Eisenbacteria bacterium]
MNPVRTSLAFALAAALGLSLPFTAVTQAAPTTCVAAPAARNPAAISPTAASATAPRRFDNAVLHVEITGKGRPMLLIPGLATSGGVWRDAVARYGDRYECHAVTLGGFAGTPRFEGPFLDTARESLLAYLRAQRLERPIVVGHSLGGVLALQLAIAAPQAIGPIVVLDAVPFLGGLGQPQATSESVRARMEPMRKMIGGQTQEAYAAFQKSSPYLRGIVTRPEDLARLIDWASSSHPATVADAMIETYSADLRERVAEIRSPLLVLGSWYGFKDFSTRETVENNFRTQYARVPHWSLAMADTARHLLMLDDPQWTWSAVNGFLDSLAAGRPNAGGRR